MNEYNKASFLNIIHNSVQQLMTGREQVSTTGPESFRLLESVNMEVVLIVWGLTDIESVYSLYDYSSL